MNTKIPHDTQTDPIEVVRKWWHKPHWQLLLGIVFVLVAVVTMQCFFPYGRSVPSARVGDIDIAHLSREEIIDVLHDKFSSVPLTVNIEGKKPIKTTSVAAGVVPAYQLIAEKITDYPIAERLIPFSFIKELNENHVELSYTIEPELFSAFEEQVRTSCATDAIDASMEFKEGKATLVPATLGRRCSETTIRKALENAYLQSSGTTIVVQHETYPPKRNDADIRPLLIAANDTISKGLSIGTPAETWMVPAEDIANWLTVNAEGTLQTKPEEIKSYLEKQRGKLYVEPGKTTIQIIDGVEVSRTTGSQGQGIDLDVTERRVSDVLLGESSTRTAWAQLTVLPPVEVVNRTYTPSNAGVQALITQWDREHNGRYGIIVRDLTDKGWNAELLPDRDFITASTYKMFLAYAVLHKVEEGELQMHTTTDMGLSVRECIDEMILHSTNACATSLFNLAGWSYVHNFILGQFPATRLDNGANADNEKHTSVRDEVTFMHRLWAGQLVNASNTDYLTGLFKRQIYRKGIPAGVPGVTVANKVGFYNGYKHDVGIIYAPNGPYILGILSYGGADWEFADLSRKVYDLMKQR